MAKAKKISNTYTENIVEETKEIVGIVIPEKLNVREKAGKDSDVLEVISKDSKVTLLKNEIIGDFYNIETESGTIGYVMSEYITIL